MIIIQWYIIYTISYISWHSWYILIHDAHWITLIAARALCSIVQFWPPSGSWDCWSLLSQEVCLWMQRPKKRPLDAVGRCGAGHDEPPGIPIISGPRKRGDEKGRFWDMFQSHHKIKIDKVSHHKRPYMCIPLLSQHFILIPGSTCKWSVMYYGQCTWHA